MKGNRADLNRCTDRKLPGLAAQTSTAKPPPALYSHSGLTASAVAGQFPRGGAVSAEGHAAARRAAGRCTASASAASYGNVSTMFTACIRYPASLPAQPAIYSRQ